MIFFSFAGRLFGERCAADFECAQELNLICARNEMRTCRCRRGYVWNIMTKMCYMIDEHSFDNGKFVDQRSPAYSLCPWIKNWIRN